MHKWNIKHKEVLENKFWIWPHWNAKKGLACDFSTRYLASDTHEIPWQELQRSLRDLISHSWEVWSTVTIPSGFWGEKSHWTDGYLCSYGPVWVSQHTICLTCTICLAPSSLLNTTETLIFRGNWATKSTFQSWLDRMGNECSGTIQA